MQLFCPSYRLQEEGLQITLASPGGQTIRGLHGNVTEPDMPIREVNPAEYELLLVPGGTSPESLRLREEAVDIARTFMEEDRRVAAVCHGPQLLISAGALSGRRATCAPGIRYDLRAAGGEYRDEGVVLDGNMITCRGNDALPSLCHHLTTVLADRR